MSDEERIIRRWFEEGWNERNDSVFDELMAPGAVGHMAHGDITGLDGFKPVWSEFTQAFPDLYLEIEEILTAPGRGAVRWRLTGTHTGPGFEMRPTSRAIDVRGTTWMHLRDGKVTAGWDTWDMGGMFGGLTAAGTAD